jgi:hypothetical protein
MFTMLKKWLLKYAVKFGFVEEDLTLDALDHWHPEEEASYYRVVYVGKDPDNHDWTKGWEVPTFEEAYLVKQAWYYTDLARWHMNVTTFFGTKSNPKDWSMPQSYEYMIEVVDGLCPRTAWHPFAPEVRAGVEHVEEAAYASVVVGSLRDDSRQTFGVDGFHYWYAPDSLWWKEQYFPVTIKYARRVPTASPVLCDSGWWLFESRVGKVRRRLNPPQPVEVKVYTSGIISSLVGAL